MTARLIKRRAIGNKLGEFVLEISYTLMLRHDRSSDAANMAVTLDRFSDEVSVRANSKPWVSQQLIRREYGVTPFALKVMHAGFMMWREGAWPIASTLEILVNFRANPKILVHDGEILFDGLVFLSRGQFFDWVEEKLVD